jgi:hypothetical protein
MVWIFEKKPAQKQEQRKRSMEEYWTAKIKQSGVQAKIDHINQTRWSLPAKEGAPVNPDAFVMVKDLMSTCYGLVRSGKIPDSAIGAVSRLIARWQTAIDAGSDEEDLAEALEMNLKQIYTKYVLSTAILPSDIGDDIAMPPIEWFMSHLNPQYQQKPPAEELKD